jgi:tetratricopeptide (TPR) repeat protein
VSRSLVESGVLRRAGDRYMLVQPVEQVSIPDTIQEVILSRIDRLQHRTKEAVQYASVIGREFPVRLLKHIHAAEESMDALLGELKALELIYEKSYFPELEYMFKHALTQEVALSTLLADRRKALHRTVATAIEELYADHISDQHEALAYHYYEGEEWEKACEYAAMVARRAAGLYAPRAVVSHATRAIEAGMRCDPNCCDPIEPELFRLRGQAYEALGEFDLSRADHEAATEYARKFGDRVAEWQAYADLGMLWAGRDYNQTGEYFQRAHDLAQEIGDEALIGHSLNRLGNWRVNMLDRPIEGVQHHEEALAIFRRSGDKQGTAETLDFLSMAHALSGDMEQALATGIEGIEMFRQLGDRQGLARLLPTVGFSGLSGVETLTIAPLSGRWRTHELAGFGEEALQIAREISSLPGQAFALCQQCASALSLGNYGLAIQSAEDALRIATEIGHTQWQVFAHYNLGCAYMFLFQFERALAHLDRARALAELSGSRHWTFITDADCVRCLARAEQLERAEEILARRFSPDLPMISLAQRGMWLARAELHAAWGNHEHAVRILDRLGATAKNADGRGVQSIPYLSLVRGECLLALGRLDAAEADLRATLDAGQSLGLKPMEWRALAALGERLVKVGREDDARKHFARAITLVEETAATIDDAALRHLYLIAPQVEELRRHTSAGAL